MSLPILPSMIWHIHGPDATETAQRVLVLGGTHGDERTGQWLVANYLERLGLKHYTPGSYQHPAVNGHLYLGYGNPEAMWLGRRAASDYRDLNRCFEPRLLNDFGLRYTDIIRARELVPLLASVNYLFDVHAVSSPGAEPFVCFGSLTQELRRLCALIPVTHVLTDPENILPTDDPDAEVLSTTDAFVARSGGTALCYETGYQDDINKLPLAEQVIVKLLEEVGVATATLSSLLLAGQPSFSPPSRPPRFYRLVRCVRVTRLDLQFVHAEGMLTNWTPVRRGDLFGRYSDGEEVIIPESGYLVFPNKVSRMELGKYFFFVAKEIV